MSAASIYYAAAIGLSLGHHPSWKVPPIEFIIHKNRFARSSYPGHVKSVLGRVRKYIQ